MKPLRTLFGATVLAVSPFYAYDAYEIYSADEQDKQALTQAFEDIGNPNDADGFATLNLCIASLLLGAGSIGLHSGLRRENDPPTIE
ncbi:MAG: hypothetical protein ACLFR0_00470 [Alphaproteobacteria bacterium]